MSTLITRARNRLASARRVHAQPLNEIVLGHLKDACAFATFFASLPHISLPTRLHCFTVDAKLTAITETSSLAQHGYSIDLFIKRGDRVVSCPFISSFTDYPLTRLDKKNTEIFMTPNGLPS